MDAGCMGGTFNNVRELRDGHELMIVGLRIESRVSFFRWGRFFIVRLC